MRKIEGVTPNEGWKPKREGQWFVNRKVRSTALFFGVHWSIGRDYKIIPVNNDKLRAFDRERRRRAPLAGLRFFQRTSSAGWFLLVSRHWPHRLCWDWSLSWHHPQRAKGEMHPLGLSVGNRWHQKVSLGLWFGSLSFVKQPYGYMLQTFGEDPAPKAIYEHNITHEAGHA